MSLQIHHVTANMSRHESIETTHLYLEADLALKEKALQKLAPQGPPARRFKADDPLLAFLGGL